MNDWIVVNYHYFFNWIFSPNIIIRDGMMDNGSSDVRWMGGLLVHTIQL